LDAGFPVELLDAEFGPMLPAEIVARVVKAAPRIVMTGHAGSSSAHPTIAVLLGLIKAALPEVVIIYGGVFPTYHWRDVLRECPEVDFIVRGEGERTTLALAECIADGGDCRRIAGLAWHSAIGPTTSGLAEPIENLDDYRVGWELIDHDRYSYWGGRKAVVVQFSRGCPYLCNYCGQRAFWRTWRHRDPVRFAQELARLYREYGVQLINFADELPTGSRPAWHHPPTDRCELGAVLGKTSSGRSRDPEKTGTARAAA
jgi:anaerobic magnesium-protoporphyrin IX monomethyl ester cyclase